MAAAYSGTPTLHTCCAICKQYFEMIKNDPPEASGTSVRRIDFHNIQTLVQSSEDGCHLCTLIVTEMDPEHRARLWTELQARGYVGEPMNAIVIQVPPEINPAPFQDPYKLILQIEGPRTEPGCINRRLVCELKFTLLTDESEARENLKLLLQMSF